LIVLVCGDRHWANDFLFEVGPTREGKRDFNYMMAILAKVDQKYGITKLYQGEAPGADQCSRYWAWISSTPMKSTPAEWEKYGKPAGPRRNRKQLRLMLKWMEKTGEDGMVLAFHRDLSVSRGTVDMIKISRYAGVRVKVFPRVES
jgi:hypothetical protein